jgi:hypothetical protein
MHIHDTVRRIKKNSSQSQTSIVTGRALDKSIFTVGPATLFANCVCLWELRERCNAEYTSTALAYNLLTQPHSLNPSTSPKKSHPKFHVDRSNATSVSFFSIGANYTLTGGGPLPLSISGAAAGWSTCEPKAIANTAHQIRCMLVK